MQKKRRFGMKNVIASVLTAALVLTSTPSGILAGELLEVETEEMEGISPVEELAETAPAEGAEDALSLFGEDDADEAMFSVSEDVEAVEAVTESDVADEEDATETVTEAAAESITDENTETVTEADAEPDAEEEAEVVEAAAVEANSVTVEGIRGWYYTYFTAELTGASVSVAVPSFLGTAAAYMQASYVDAAGYEEMINADNYGKVAADLKAIEITFLNSRGKVVKVGTVGAEIEIAPTGAESYVMYQQGKSSMKKAASSDDPYFSFKINNGGTYVFAGLVADGADRTEGVTSNGTTTFDLTTSDGTVITASTSSKSFSADTVYMEAENVLTEDTVVAASFAEENETAVEVVRAMDISFHNEEGTETEPARDVTVTIATPLTMEGEYQLVHIKDNGETEIVENAVFDENGVTFTVDEFSKFVLTWKDSSSTEQQSATILWGYMDGEQFVELEEGSTVTLDTSASTVSLENSFEGYHYLGAVYCAAGQTYEQGVDIGTILHKGTNGWEYDEIDSEDGTTTRKAIAANSSIYVTYFKPGEPTPSGAGHDDVPSPETTKTVTDNGDGTYDIELIVSPTSVTEDHSHYANVLVILDATRSMDGAKWTNAKAAMKTLIETLTEGENAGNAGKIDFALVTFGRSATVVQNWTKNNTSFKSTCAGINMVSTSGTNWEAGMRGGLYGVLSAYPQGETAEKHDPTYVIFLTDGDPNVYYNGGSANNYSNDNTTPGYQQNSNTSANASADEAKTIAATTKLYGIYCGDSGTTPSGTSYNRLVNVITGSGQGGVKTIAANADTIESEFQAIAQTMLDEMGASNVAVDDGVPSLAGISANANVIGETGGYEYSIKEPNDADFKAWPDAPGATYSSDNGVTWDLSNEGTLPAGTQYRIRFTVWPSQAAYDLIADLNNSLVDYDDLSEKEQTWVTGSKEDGYTLVTNTHLNTTYTYNNQEYSDAKPPQYKAMPLPTKDISIVKLWPDNQLDSYGAATYRDENGEEQTATEITLTLKKDNDNYLDVTVKAEDGWKKDDVYVSCGNMTVKNGEVTIHEPGHDYQVTEPAAFSYYWDLISDVYHPMVINGTATLLVLDKDATSADNTDTYEINGKIYRKHSDTENELTASNYRRSNLNLTKVVSTTGGQDGYFTYTATVTDANSTDGNVWFSAFDPELNATVKEEWVISGATPEAGNTGYWYATNGATVTFKIKQGWNVRFLNLYHGSTFSFEETAMPDYYEFEKAEVAASEEFMDKDITDEDWSDIQGKKVTGTIIEPNNSYTVTYTNKYEAFYVYHSGVEKDGNLEVHPLKSATTDETELAHWDGEYFDLLTTNKTPYTLYGGYYMNYAGKGDYKGDGVKGTTGKKYDGVNNDWTEPVFDNFDTSGSKVLITPLAGKTYYIKEVPTSYLQNYIHYTYNKSTTTLTGLYLISAIDDKNYTETGFYLQKVKKDNKALDSDGVKVKVVSKITIKDSSGSYELKPNNCFYKDYNGNERLNPITGTDSNDRLTYYAPVIDKQYFKVGANYTMLPYWVTPDGIEITGTSTRTVNITALNLAGLDVKDDTTIFKE